MVWGFVWGFCVCFSCLFLFLYRYYIAEEELAGYFTLIVFGCLCSVSLPRGALGWSFICNIVSFSGRSHCIFSRGSWFSAV